MSLSLAIVVILGVMVVATAIRLGVQIRRRERPTPDTFLAALFGAVALTLNLDAFYLWLDGLLGAINLVDLAKHTSLVLSSFFLARAVLAVVNRLTTRLARALLLTLLVTLVVQSVAFAAIDAHPTTTMFMATFGDRGATLVYSLSHFTYFAVAETIAVAVAITVSIRGESRLHRFALVALAIGGAASVANFMIILVRDTSRLAGATDIADALNAPYQALVLLIAVGSCIGLGFPAAVGAARRHKVSKLVARLQVVSERWNVTSYLDDEEDHLQREEVSTLRQLVISLRTAQSAGLQLDPTEVDAIETAERFLSRHWPQ